MQFRSLVQRSLLVLLILGLAACKKYTIEAPLVDSVHENVPQIRVTYASQPNNLPPMHLNGFDVRSLFEAGPNAAVASGIGLEPYLKEGYNIFQVEPPLGPQVKFIYDTQGPEIMVMGAVENGDNTVTIGGFAVDEMGVRSGSLNSEVIHFNQDKSFTITVPVPADGVYSYQTEDTLGHTNTVHYAALGNTYNPAVTVNITQQGLDTAVWGVVNALNGADLNQLLGGTALYNTTWTGLFGETYGADGFVQDISLSVDSLGLDLQAGNQIALAGDINHLHIALALRMHNGLLPPTVINVGASVSLKMAATVGVSVQDQAPVVTINGIQYEIGPIALDGLPPLFNDMVSVIGSGIANLIEGPVSKILEGVLNLAIPQLISGLVTESLVIDIADHTQTHFKMAMALGIESLTTTDGALQAAVSGSLVPVNPSAAIPQPLAGTLFTFDNLPPAELNDKDLAISLNSNLINQVLASAHAVGLTHLSMIGGGEGDYSIQLGLPRDENFGSAEATHRILVNMAAPASLKVRPVEGRAEPTFKVYGLEIHGQSRKKGSTQFTNDIAVRVSAEVSLVLNLGTDNKLAVNFRQAPKITLEGVKVGNAAWSGAVVNAAADRLISTTVGMVLKELVSPIEHIKLPSFICMSFQDVDVTAVGQEGGHLNLALSLAQADGDCVNQAAPPPAVAYGRVGLPMSCADGMENDVGLCYSACPEGYAGVGPVCWKQGASYTRGLGTIPNGCESGKVMDAGLCYTPCRAGYNGVGPVCYSQQSISYRRGAGTIPSNIWTGACPSGKENQAGLCYTACNAGYHGVGPICWLDEPSYGRGIGTLPNQCSGGKANEGGLCYAPCNPGYHGIGSVCWTDQNLSEGRGVGTLPNTCAEGWEKSAALCYSPCKAGFIGVGSICQPDN